MGIYLYRFFFVSIWVLFILCAYAHIYGIYFYNIANSPIYFRSKTFYRINPITYHIGKDKGLNHIYLSFTLMDIILCTYVHTHMYSYISVILPKTSFIFVLRDFYIFSLITLPYWHGYCLRQANFGFICNFFIYIIYTHVHTHNIYNNIANLLKSV